MSDKIKTREFTKDIKVIDKSVNAADRMKNAYVRTKDAAQNTQQTEHYSPSEYATDNTTRSAEKTAYKIGHQVKKHTGKIVDKVKDAHNAKKQADNVSEPAREQSKKYTQQNMRKSTQATKQAAEKTIRTAPKVENTIKQSVKTTGKTVKVTAKGTIKTAQKTVKSAEYTAKATIKTSQQTAKVAVKTAQATAKTTRVAVQSAQTATKAAVTTAKAAVKATIVAVKAIIAAIQELVSLIAAGGWIAVVIILIVCMAAMIFASPFGIFSGGGDNGTPTIKEVIATVNSEWDSKIEQLKTDASYVDETVITINGTVVTSARVQNWADVLSVYSVETSTGDDPTDVATLDSNRISILKSVFNDMNTVTSNTEVTTDENNNAITKLTIEITSKNYIDMVSVYNFNSEQQEILNELMSEENRSMWQAITG